MTVCSRTTQSADIRGCSTGTRRCSGGQVRLWDHFYLLFRLDSQIPFFCGDLVFCRMLGHEKAVEKAKENIEKSFLVVGTLEEMDKTIMVMECVMPEYMKGLVEMNKQTNIHKHSKHDKVIPLSSKARVVMKSRLSKEYELYEFVQEKLEKQFRECGKRQL